MIEEVEDLQEEEVESPHARGHSPADLAGVGRAPPLPWHTAAECASRPEKRIGMESE